VANGEADLDGAPASPDAATEGREVVAIAAKAATDSPKPEPKPARALRATPPAAEAARAVQAPMAETSAKLAAAAQTAVERSVEATGVASRALTLSVAHAVPAISEPTTKTTMERMMTTAEDLVAFGQGNIEAFVKAGQIWAAGLQDLGKTVAESAQAQMEQSVSAFKALSTVKSLREAMDLQSTHARAALEKAVSDSGKLTDASMKLAEQAMAPLTARMTIAAERFGRTA